MCLIVLQLSSSAVNHLMGQMNCLIPCVLTGASTTTALFEGTQLANAPAAAQVNPFGAQAMRPHFNFIKFLVTLRNLAPGEQTSIFNRMCTLVHNCIVMLCCCCCVIIITNYYVMLLLCDYYNYWHYYTLGGH